MNVLVRECLSFFVCSVIAAGAVAVSGCGGDEGEAESASASSAGNHTLTISGRPLTAVMQDTAYSFTPNVSDTDGDMLTFSVANLPVWATFNPSTGRLSGTPTPAHLGIYSNIRISASDGSANADLAAFSIQVVATATGSATLTWNPPTQNTDGSALTNLGGYKIYWGTTHGSYANSVTVDSPGLATYVVGQLTPAEWYFTVTAVTNTGVESGLSNVLSKQVL